MVCLLLSRMSVIHALPVKACATVFFLKLEMVKRFGAKSFGRQPRSQPEFQKLALIPLPIVISVQAAKSNLSLSSHGVCVPLDAVFILLDDDIGRHSVPIMY